MTGRIAAVSQDAAVHPEEAGYRAHIRIVPLPLAMLDLDFRPVELSKGWLDEAMTPATQGPITPFFVGDQLHEARARCLAGEAVSLRLETRVQPGEAPRWWSVTMLTWPRDGCGVQRLVVNAHEVTEVVRTAFAAEQARQRLQMALKLDRSVVRDVNLRTGEVHITSMHPDLERHFIGRSPVQSAHPDDQARLDQALTACAEHGAPFHLRYRLNRADGAETWIDAIGERFLDIGGEPDRVITVLKDVTERQIQQQRIEALAFRDVLTGLSNRAAFQAALDDAIQANEERGEPFGLVMIDVDHFKQINDTLGHDAGDALLIALAEQLRRAFRQTDTVARLGGDEFAVVLRRIEDDQSLLRPIASLQEMLRVPIQHGGQSLCINASIGAALHTAQDGDPHTALKNADVALYQAKSDGRNRCVLFERAMRAEAEDRLQLLRDVRQGLIEQQFSMFYQPIIDLAARRVEGVEALMRWRHPLQGVLEPERFMVAFEDPELGPQLGALALDEALAQMRAWLDRGVDVGRVAINVSASQFRSGRLAQDIEDKLRRWDLPARVLTLEVNESIYTGASASTVIDTISRLDVLGVKVALDDFGAGYASLVNLRRFPIDRLKISKSFVANNDEVIVDSIIRLGAALGIQVVADGVEQSGQLEAVRRYGCEHAQGFHFARPMQGDDMADYVVKFGAEGGE